MRKMWISKHHITSLFFCSGWFVARSEMFLPRLRTTTETHQCFLGQMREWPQLGADLSRRQDQSSPSVQRRRRWLRRRRRTGWTRTRACTRMELTHFFLLGCLNEAWYSLLENKKVRFWLHSLARCTGQILRNQASSQRWQDPEETGFCQTENSQE